MKLLLLLPLLLISDSRAQNSIRADETTPFVIVTSKWFKDRQALENAVSARTSPAPAMIDENKVYVRQQRENRIGERDPNADTLDGRGAELDRIVNQSREGEPIYGFTYQFTIRNTSPRSIQNIFWEFQFVEAANPANVTHRQFLCSSKIKPSKQRDLQVFSLSGPSDIISIKSLEKDPSQQFRASVIVNRLEYSDGTFWQRNGWSLEGIKLRTNARSGNRSLPVCRSL